MLVNESAGVAKNVCALELATTSALQAIFAQRALRGMDSEDSGPLGGPRTARKKSEKGIPRRDPSCDGTMNIQIFLLLAALISFSLNSLIKMQPDMDATSLTISNDLPFKFPGRNTDAFPNPWPNRDLAGKHARDKTPKRNTKEWNAILDFKESKDWQTGDLQKFAN